jgi:hypothetical protein
MLMTTCAAFALFASVLCLEIIGPPPRWRIDALWVWGHSRTVRLMIVALLIAACATVAVFVVQGRDRQRRRAMIAAMWIGASIACAVVYWDRAPIIYDVVMRYAW